ncbi:MAG: uncharacterized protein A8A55_1106, partial [Amphiamblys sp. WSBS2006]
WLSFHEENQINGITLAADHFENITRISKAKKRSILECKVKNLRLERYAVEILPKLRIDEGNEMERFRLSADHETHITGILGTEKNSILVGKVKVLELRDYAAEILPKLRFNKENEMEELSLSADHILCIGKKPQIKQNSIWIGKLKRLRLEGYAVEVLPKLGFHEKNEMEELNLCAAGFEQISGVLKEKDKSIWVGKVKKLSLDRYTKEVEGKLKSVLNQTGAGALTRIGHSSDLGALRVPTKVHEEEEPPKISRLFFQEAAAEIAADKAWSDTPYSAETFQKKCGEILRAHKCLARTPKDKPYRQDHKTRLEILTKEAEKDFRSGETRAIWRLANYSCYPLREEEKTNPVRDKEGVLQVDPEAIAKAWGDHYQVIHKDKSGNSRNSKVWKAKLTRRNNPDTTDLDRELRIEEIDAVLFEIKTGTAAGPDGIIPEVLKAAMVKGPMKDCLISLLRKTWNESHIPKEWECAEVMTFHKNGDTESMDNYRGISLLPVVLKVLCTIAARRLNRHMEKNNLFDRRQAGFRKREECLGNVVGLLETIQQRKTEGKKSFLGFIDFKKAYDCVPHGALLSKLGSEAGAQEHGRFMRFVRELYRNPWIIVRMKKTKIYCPLEVGLRQGCPMSSVLFNVFINDVFSELGEGGIDQSGAGLVFADDLLIIGGTNEILRRAVETVQRWADTWEMEINPAKCGLLVIGASKEEKAAAKMTVQGKDVVAGESYTYLGIMLDETLSLKKMALGRKKKGVGALALLEKSLRGTVLPIEYKALLIRGLVIPAMSYGAEAYGSTAAITWELQKVANIALKIISGNECSLTAVRRDLGIPPIQATAVGAQNRALKKFPTLKTEVARILNNGKTDVKCWLGRTREETKNKRTKDGVWRFLEGKEKAKSWKRYKENNFEKTSKLFRQLTALEPTLQKGWKAVLQIRTGHLWTCERAARRGVADEWLLTECPCCEKETPETPLHRIFTCEKWEPDREKADTRVGISRDERIKWGEGTDEPAGLLIQEPEREAGKRMMWVAIVVTLTEEKRYELVRPLMRNIQKKSRSNVFEEMPLKLESDTIGEEPRLNKRKTVLETQDIENKDPGLVNQK